MKVEIDHSETTSFTVFLLYTLTGLPVILQTHFHLVMNFSALSVFIFFLFQLYALKQFSKKFISLACRNISVLAVALQSSAVSL